MRICIAYKSKQGGKLEDYAKSLALGLEQQSSAVVDIINISVDSDKKLTGYKYILFGSDKESFFGTKVHKSYRQFLKNCGHISGKHSFAFTEKGFNAAKFLSNFMKVLESEGVFLKNSAIISSKEQAKVIGSKLHINK